MHSYGKETIGGSSYVEENAIPYLLKVLKEQNGSRLGLVRLHCTVKLALQGLKKKRRKPKLNTR